jgi:hypothetical protein
MSTAQPGPCANCHARPATGPLLCAPCRSIADSLIAALPAPAALVSGSGAWDLSLLPKPAKRVRGLATSHGD